MSTVTTSRQQPKNRRPEIACSGCDWAGRCACLMEHRLHRETMPLLRQLLEAGTDLTKRREARQALAHLLAQSDQRVREAAALKRFTRYMFDHPHPRFAASRDRDALDHMVGDWSRLGDAVSVEEAATRWRRPVSYLRDLRDRALRALQAPTAQSRTSTASRRAA